MYFRKNQGVLCGISGLDCMFGRGLCDFEEIYGRFLLYPLQCSNYRCYLCVEFLRPITDSTVGFSQNGKDTNQIRRIADAVEAMEDTIKSSLYRCDISLFALSSFTQ